MPLSVVSASFRFRVFLIRELTRATSRINECARLFEILLAHRVYAAFISTIRQILDSFVRILNTRPAIRDPLELTAVAFTHVYEVSPRKDRRGAALISDALPFGALLYGEPNAISNAIGYTKHRSRSHRAVIRVTMLLAMGSRRTKLRDLTQTDAGCVGRADFSPGWLRDCSPHKEKRNSKTHRIQV